MKLMSTAKTASHYNADWTAFNLEFGGEQAGRSLVKSTVAIAYDAGIDPRACDLALDYLLNEDAEPCFGYFYDKDRDLVINRPRGKPFHCVGVKGNPGTGTILAYVEFYSLYRVVLCLSESYSGEAFTDVYAIDPVKGEEIELSIDLDLSTSDVRSAYDYEICDEGVRRSAASSLFEYVVAAEFNRALDRNIRASVANAFAKCDAEEGEVLSDAQLRQLIANIVQYLTPFIQHNAARFGFVPDPGTEARPHR